MNVAIIVAGGTGDRAGLAGGKQLVEVGRHPALHHTVAAFAACPRIDSIVVVAHPKRVEEYRATAVATVDSPKVAMVAAGGDTRQDSVARGLDAVPADADIIAVHDGARPLVTPELIADAIVALESDPSLDGIVVGHPSYDTLKQVDARGRVIGTLDRVSIWAAQTPQVFRADTLRRAYLDAAAHGYTGTDDASLVERVGGEVLMMLGPRDNIKITVPEDIPVVERLLQLRAEGRRDG